VANEGELTVALPNGTTLWFKSGEKADALYGENVHAAVVDEASRFREESWHALRSTLTATRGPVRLIGNVKGRRNWFYHLARRAESGEPDMRYTKITWRDAVESGILAAAEIDDARRMLPEAVFRELFEAEPSDDAGNPFGLAAIQRCIGPLSEARPVCWGWDLAKSVDWTVGVALDAEGVVARIERWQSPWEETIGNIAAATAGLPALVDSTGVGDPILEALQRRGSGQFEGFKFSGPSKQQLMEGLAVAIQQQAIRFPAGVLVQELEAFEYEYRRTGVSYSAPEGLHDDAVCALALAVQHRRVGVLEPLRLW
jgi:phage FluMu gp28-like protein